MSTRSMIFVAVNPKDIGKLVIYEPAVNTAGIKFYEDQEVKQWSIENDIIANRKYISIYCHSDGYPEGIGRTLITFYNDYEKAFNLMGAGAIVYLEKISESFMDTPPATSDEIIIKDPISIEYVYLFQNGTWNVLSTKNDRKETIYKPEQFQTVKEYLKK